MGLGYARSNTLRIEMVEGGDNSSRLLDSCSDVNS